MGFRRWLARQVRIVNVGPIWVMRGELDSDPIELWRRQVLGDSAYCTWAATHNPSFRDYCDVDLRSSFAMFATQEFEHIQRSR